MQVDVVVPVVAVWQSLQLLLVSPRAASHTALALQPQSAWQEATVSPRSASHLKSLSQPQSEAHAATVSPASQRPSLLQATSVAVPVEVVAWQSRQLLLVSPRAASHTALALQPQSVAQLWGDSPRGGWQTESRLHPQSAWQEATVSPKAASQAPFRLQVSALAVVAWQSRQFSAVSPRAASHALSASHPQSAGQEVTVSPKAASQAPLELQVALDTVSVRELVPKVCAITKIDSPRDKAMAAKTPTPTGTNPRKRIIWADKFLCT
ncbi:hypothetical protein A3C96_01545 [Candidatus Uhrbacteria bacterium RIFCSPHIGHO2_02_FULL_60_10]|uniref:Uncharacterized protein n=1 Tax=Candidatus Uhrbacteria bacterium RIFCSPHIGHO2_02_FULL_60_10 TaxID=1802392 RepID=A0A1F7U652_9BACT|nr:MAG: hypothetical protein A3C96_01545 [Candidatus Uhrbacteria bacterium RIFCSPHIGHO2_02_FULL_60_10]